MSLLRSIPSLLVLMVVLGLLLSCCRKNVHQPRTGNGEQTTLSATSLIAPKGNTVITWGDSVKIELSAGTVPIQVDSVSITAGTSTRVIPTASLENLFWSSRGSRVGQTALRIKVYYNDSLQDSHNISLVILSDLIPKPYSYRITRQYPHDDQAYTQGLVYDGGVLYESTGLESKSSLRIVDIPTGHNLKMVGLAPQYFGEGIALFKNQIYQVTYKNQVGFVYDKQSLQQIRGFDYQFREGWGLTTNGQYLIMSDGSAQLYFIEPEYFTQIDKIEVFDNKGLISSLNELEYINGKILANVYGQTYIVIIDPLTGKVTGKVDLDKLMPEGSRGDYGKVLNGIAYNPQTGHLYVTGKNWPYLYEILLTPSL
jgi:glutaminyl-peptide cyclotransferase